MVNSIERTLGRPGHMISSQFNKCDLSHESPFWFTRCERAATRDSCVYTSGYSLAANSGFIRHGSGTLTTQRAGSHVLVRTVPSDSRAPAPSPEWHSGPRGITCPDDPDHFG